MEPLPHAVVHLLCLLRNTSPDVVVQLLERQGLRLEDGAALGVAEVHKVGTGNEVDNNDQVHLVSGEEEPKSVEVSERLLSRALGRLGDEKKDRNDLHELRQPPAKRDDKMEVSAVNDVLERLHDVLHEVHEVHGAGLLALCTLLQLARDREHQLEDGLVLADRVLNVVGEQLEVGVRRGVTTLQELLNCNAHVRHAETLEEARRDAQLGAEVAQKLLVLL
mmetsp:Transcript_15693/g.61293  ORF Transcript_15693/g.61293 Transcript_15693/m.61293 type:complete len:221 (+) Transcript_15693:696-1358(+)